MEKKLFLHTCCAPCLTSCLTVLQGKSGWERVLPGKPDYKITIFYYNPNIQPENEYLMRIGEVRRLATIMGNVPVEEGKYDNEKWMKAALPLKDEPERGKRCHLCYEIRLRETFGKAIEQGYHAVATTLTLSPHKDAVKINEIGNYLAIEYGIEYLESDFKKDGGYQRSIELSKKYSLYRQNYCGCVFSRENIQLKEKNLA